LGSPYGLCSYDSCGIVLLFGNCYISRKQKDALNAQFRSLEETSSLTPFKKIKQVFERLEAQRRGEQYLFFIRFRES